MICLDSSFLIDILRNKKEAVDKAREMEKFGFGITSISVFEVMIGFYLKNKDYASRYANFEELISNLEVLNLDLNSAILSSKISAKLTTEGKIIEQSDCLIAGIMFSNGVSSILTRNISHFTRIKGIKVIPY